MPGNPRIRASDADRDRTTALLREHHAAGRLTAEEFHERMDQALEAKTLGELDKLLEDLPVIDLYRLPDEALRRPAGLPHSYLAPPVPARRDPRPGEPRRAARPGEQSPDRIPPGTLAVGAWAAVAGTLVAVWAVTAVIGVGTWFPWWLLVVIPAIWVMIRRARRRSE